MSIRFTQLQCKEVICVSDGRRLGFVTDVQVEIPGGNVCAIVVPCPARFPGGFGRRDDGTASGASVRTLYWWRRSPTTAGCREESRGCRDNRQSRRFFSPTPEFFCVFWEIMLAITRSILYNDSAWALTRDISKPHTRGSAAPVSERTGCRDDRGGGKTKGEIVKWLSYL